MCGAGQVACVSGRWGRQLPRGVSADTMKLLLPIRRGAGEAELGLALRPNQIAIRIGAAAIQAGLGEGYSWGQPIPRGLVPSRGLRLASLGQ